MPKPPPAHLAKALALCAAALALAPHAALAYIGPGAGLSAIGTVLALVAAVFLAILGFVWYPIKRLRARLSGTARASTDEANPAEDAGEAAPEPQSRNP
jgi:type VI protein secretion system component VasK